MKNQIHYILTQIFERLNHGRLVVPDGLDRGEVVVQEVDPVALEDAVGPGRLPPGQLHARVGHAQDADVARLAGSCKNEEEIGELGNR